MKISLIEVPYHLGQENVGVAKGASRYREAGLDSQLQHQGIDLTIETVQREGEYCDELTAIASVNASLAAIVRQSVNTEHLPIVLAGDCNSSLGTLAGFNQDTLGVIWFDAHGDFNTPQTSPSGFFDGMPVAIVVGDCYQDLWKTIGRNVPIPAASVLLVGTRDIDAEEQQRLDRSELQVARADEIKRSGLLETLLPKLEQLQTQVSEIYLHLDIDALDPQDAPGAGYRCPNGLSIAEVRDALRLIGDRFKIRAMAITNYRPDWDENDKTLQAIQTLLQTVILKVDTLNC